MTTWQADLHQCRKCGRLINASEAPFNGNADWAKTEHAVIDHGALDDRAVATYFYNPITRLQEAIS